MNTISSNKIFETVAHLNGEKRIPGGSSTNDSEFENVERAFYKTFNETGNEGLATEFLFFTPNPADEDTPVGGQAWDIVSTSPDFDHAHGMEHVLETAFSAGLMDLVPPNVKLCENGPGTHEVWIQKTGPFIQAILDSPDHELQSALFIDKSRRYAQRSAVSSSETYNIEEVYGLKGDFIGSQERIRVGQGTPFVIINGGPFANAPTEKNGLNEIQYLEKSFHNMREQHGLGAHFLIEIDLPQDKEKLKQSYSVNPPDTDKCIAFRNFVLGLLFRAKHNGIISNPNYNILQHWRAKMDIEELDHNVTDKHGSQISAKAQKIRLSAESIQPHTIECNRGTMKIEEGYSPRTQILSHKFDKAIWEHAARRASASNIKFFTHKNRALMYGTFSARRP